MELILGRALCHIPDKLKALLRAVRRGESEDLIEALRSFFLGLEAQGLSCIETNHPSLAKWFSDLGTKAGLGGNISELPYLLFKEFCREQEAADTASLKAMSEEEIVRVLTVGGTIPLDCIFLLDGQIYIWDPKAHLKVLLIEDNTVASACRQFLLRRAASYGSLNEVRKVAEKQRWPNYETLIGDPSSWQG